jgi:hypothetical protein
VVADGQVPLEQSAASVAVPLAQLGELHCEVG